MASYTQTPQQNGFYESVPQPSDSLQNRGYGNLSQHDFAHEGERPITVGDTVGNPHSITLEDGGVNRTVSNASTAAYRDITPSRAGTLKKKASVSRKSSLNRSGSRRSTRAGSIAGVGTPGAHDDYNSALSTPIPTHGSPTDILANRFQAWRTLLKSLITYFREIQSSYETRSKALLKVSNVLSNFSHPSVFITDGGLADASRILGDYHKHSVAESNKSRDIEQDVISALTGLRSDLSQKIKEIKSLNGDFKNSVDKEKDATRKAVDQLAEALQHADHGDNSKTDPYIVRLGVDRMVEKQIDEENYLHRAYLNLESSGRELESIVVGEIQKAYNAMASILKREGDDAYNTVEQLRGGPIAMPKDLEWARFVETDPHFVNPRLPLRRIEDIDYPGKNAPAAAEVRAGMLERKSKYLKSYTPGWYVLSPTHLHEFKSADKIYSQPPVMSLYLPEQKLGSHSEPGSSSHKFMLKGRQSSGMHRGHNWVFRAESYETMMAWYEAIKILTEKTAEERNAFVRQHVRSISQNSHRNSISSDGLEEDEADQVPYSAQSSVINQPIGETRLQRPVPGGRFPSDLQIPRTLAASPDSESDEPEHHNTAAATALPGVVALAAPTHYDDNPYRLEGVSTHEEVPAQQRVAFTSATPGSIAHARETLALREDAPHGSVAHARETMPLREDAPSTPGSYQPNPVDNFNHTPIQPAAPQNNVVQPTQTFVLPVQHAAPAHQLQRDVPVSPIEQQQSLAPASKPVRQNTNYSEWMAPAAAGVGAGALGAEAYHRHQDRDLPSNIEEEQQTPYADERPRELTGGHAAMPTSNEAATSNPAAFANNNGISGATYTGTAPFPVLIPNSANVPQSPEFVPYSASTFGAPTPAAEGSEHLGGLESDGAHQTGAIFPRVVRHDTDMSVSQLHVPGEFPPATPGFAPTEEKTERSLSPRPAIGSHGTFIAPSAWELARE
ncbi:hypothetical protein D6D19_06873 [Aureobasidium pullulans]|uniref:PH domain-containing protein n=1 Tax=Aureobasidium pullulans TaxID=5580 RepID=A0A4S8ZZI3_AURPU|nr:hypothetical protein D6D19_06873 [Aureobasidium pullulans]